MYVLSRRMCWLLVNLVAHPWECLTMYDPQEMCQHIRSIFETIGENLYFDVVSHPVVVKDGLIHRAYITVMSKRPEMVLGVVNRVVLKDMKLELFFTDEFGDECALNSVSFRTCDTAGLTLDSEERWS